MWMRNDDEDEEKRIEDWIEAFFYILSFSLMEYLKKGLRIFASPAYNSNLILDPAMRSLFRDDVPEYLQPSPGTIS